MRVTDSYKRGTIINVSLCICINYSYYSEQNIKRYIFLIDLLKISKIYNY